MFIFTFLCGTSKGFMKAFKVFKVLIKGFKAPQKSVKINKLIFSVRPELGREGSCVPLGKK